MTTSVEEEKLNLRFIASIFSHESKIEEHED